MVMTGGGVHFLCTLGRYKAWKVKSTYDGTLGLGAPALAAIP